MFETVALLLYTPPLDHVAQHEDCEGRETLEGQCPQNTLRPYRHNARSLHASKIIFLASDEVMSRCAAGERIEYNGNLVVSWYIVSHTQSATRRAQLKRATGGIIAYGGRGS